MTERASFATRTVHLPGVSRGGHAAPSKLPGISLQCTVLPRRRTDAFEFLCGKGPAERAVLAGEHIDLSGVIAADGVIMGGERIALHPRSKPLALAADACACFKHGHDDALQS